MMAVDSTNGLFKDKFLGLRMCLLTESAYLPVLLVSLKRLARIG